MKTKNKQHHACPLNIKLESDLSKKNSHILKKKVQIYTKHFIAASVLDSFSPSNHLKTELKE